MTILNNPLSREQKLMAEAIVQLGNIVEQLQVIAGGGTEAQDYQQQISVLQTALAQVQQEKAELIETLQQSQVVITTLQNQVATSTSKASAMTPDNITDVMNQLGINYIQDEQ